MSAKTTNEFSKMSDSLKLFIEDWKLEYQTEVSKLDMFDPTKTISWTTDQQKAFASVFNHSRGHYYRFLWYLGSLAPNKDYREIVLQNYADEFGRSVSHEQLYWDFAGKLGVDVKHEILYESSNYEFIRDFNHNHLEWLLTKNWTSCWAAFSAYEAMDNIDYENLYKLALSFGFKENDKAMVFFKIHLVANHFNTTLELLEEVWQTDTESVKVGFEFIRVNQLRLFTAMSEYLMRLG